MHAYYYSYYLTLCSNVCLFNVSGLLVLANSQQPRQGTNPYRNMYIYSCVIKLHPSILRVTRSLIRKQAIPCPHATPSFSMFHKKRGRAWYLRSHVWGKTLHSRYDIAYPQVKWSAHKTYYDTVCFGCSLSTLLWSTTLAFKHLGLASCKTSDRGKLRIVANFDSLLALAGLITQCHNITDFRYQGLLAFLFSWNTKEVNRLGTSRLYLICHIKLHPHQWPPLE